MFVNAFTTVFKNKRYALLAGAVALIVFAFATWLPNIRLLFSIITDSTIPVSLKLTFPVHLLKSITTNFTLLSASYAIAIAVLTGINIALIVYYVRQQKEKLSQVGIVASTLGILSGVLGMGCAACGSLILVAILGTTGGASVLALLPLHGGEFGIIGVILLGTATYILTKKIAKPFVCERAADEGRLYKCPVCGFMYREKELAEKCETWCKKYQTCNIEIITHAVAQTEN